jgi:hypothetical protein
VNRRPAPGNLFAAKAIPIPLKTTFSRDSRPQFGHSHLSIRYAFNCPDLKKIRQAQQLLCSSTDHMRHQFRSSTPAASSLMHAGTDGRSGIQQAFVLGDK